jgi:hypothetical protein
MNLVHYRLLEARWARIEKAIEPETIPSLVARNPAVAELAKGLELPPFAKR